MAGEQRYPSIAIVAVDDNRVPRPIAAVSGIADVIRSTGPGESCVVPVARVRAWRGGASSGRRKRDMAIGLEMHEDFGVFTHPSGYDGVVDEFDDLLGRRDTGRLSRARYRKALAVLVERNPWFIDGHDGGRYIIIDTADNFEEPHWEVSRADRRSEREPVTRD